jgi:rubredoxin
MPLVTLECPICEFVFEAAPHVTDRVRCTCCGHLFANRKSTIQTSKSPAAESQQPLPAEIPETNTPSAKDGPQEMVGRSDQLRSSIMLKRRRARRRSNLILLLLFLGTLIAGVVTAKRFWKYQDPAPASAPNPNPNEDKNKRTE